MQLGNALWMHPGFIQIKKYSQSWPILLPSLNIHAPYPLVHDLPGPFFWGTASSEVLVSDLPRHLTGAINSGFFSVYWTVTLGLRHGPIGSKARVLDFQVCFVTGGASTTLLSIGLDIQVSHGCDNIHMMPQTYTAYSTQCILIYCTMHQSEWCIRNNLHTCCLGCESVRFEYIMMQWAQCIPLCQIQHQ